MGAVSLNMMYEKLVKPVKAGKEGYAMVKDRDGIILMHPAEDQIGIDVIATRKERHPDFEFHELESLIEQQFANEEGTTIYHSYWWTDKKPQKTKKLNAFSRAYIGEEFWIVAMALSYNELEGPIRQHLVKIVQVAFVIILIISVAIFIILKIQKNKEALEVETKYLKELNATTEELRKKDLQLQHSQKLQALGTLTGGIAHEFNNLLTPILGYTEILKKSVAIDSKDYEYINEIYDASRKAKNIIEQILVFSRLDRNTTKYEPIQVSLLVEETLNLIRPTLTSNIKISYEDSSDGSCIMANQVQIHQVLLNLYNNAFHAMKDAEGVLKVTLSTVKRNEAPENYTSASETEEYVQITVSDSGYGMSAEAVTRIFEPFFTTKGLGEGTGLGLFVVQGIVRNHKGLITVESVVDKGSTFKVYFPKVQGTPSVAEEEKIEFKKLKGLKPVLMVDDNPKVLKVMKKGLENFGLEVLAETNSVEALNIFKQDPSRFEVVITDQAMPDLRGVELAERLKKLNPRVKIILVTGYADEKVAEYMKRMIIDYYLNKPVIGKQMAKAVCDVLEKDY
ncbi:MAG TPA: histidine kinase [Firmicutes bacterium]|nr:histidine kinase [Bacillota bacterium]